MSGAFSCRGRPRRTSPNWLRSALFRLVIAMVASVFALPITFAQAAPALRSDNQAAAIRIQVRSVSPSVPVPSLKPRPFTVVLALTNLTPTPLHHVTITGTRGDPIGNRAALNAALHQPFAASGLPVTTRHPVTVDLPADGAAHFVTFATTTGIPLNSGICLCHDAEIYPLSFTASVTDPNGAPRPLATAGTFLPAFDAAPAPAHVSWVWPLLDRPHRVADTRDFTDDLLTNEVGFGGRLDRSLTVLEGVAPYVPVTVVVDPDLLDELEVMASGKYTVQVGKHRVAGKGTAAATAWLGRLRALLAGNPNVRIAATPFGDVDVQSLAARGLTWQNTMPPAMAQRVRIALDGHPLDANLVWPADGRLGSRTLAKLASRGIRQAVLATAGVSPADGAHNAVPHGVARLSRRGHRIGVALTDPVMQNYVASIVDRGGPGLAQLPQLMAEIAVRVAQNPGKSHSVVLTPPRYADVDPPVAVRAILDTSHSVLATPVALNRLVAADRLPPNRSHLAKVPASAATLPESVIDVVQHATATLPTVDSLLGVGTLKKISPAATTVIATLPDGLQRSESSYWLGHPASATRFAHRYVRQVDALTQGVQILPPKIGAYTLASSNSLLPVTVANGLPYRVYVRLRVATTNGLPGFTVSDIGAQSLDPHSQRTLHLPTSIARSGRLQIIAQLETPAQQRLGSPITLTVHSTAFGTLGIVITIAAGVVLLLALLVRGLRWLRRRSAGDAAGGTPVSPASAAEAADEPVAMPADSPSGSAP